jgi:hypothetical protein
VGWNGEGERVEWRVEVRLERGGACRDGRMGDTGELIEDVVKQIRRRGVVNQPNLRASRERVQVARQINRGGSFEMGSTDESRARGRLGQNVL